MKILFSLSISDECDNGNIQLVGGETVNEGRVEVCAFGQWGTVCDDGWNTAGAKVVCDSLGIFGGYTFSPYSMLHI